MSIAVLAMGVPIVVKSALMLVQIIVALSYQLCDVVRVIKQGTLSHKPCNTSNIISPEYNDYRFLKS
jgi:hypothetical protein